MTSQMLLLKTFVGAKILFGIVWPHTIVQEASFWGPHTYFDIGAIDEGDFYVKFILEISLMASSLHFMLSMDRHNIIIKKPF